jgi:glycosyltransferase involved in cell wall biosynthesis
MTAPELSVVICSHDPEPATLRRVIDAIVPQLRQPPQSELIVIDNNSDPPLTDQCYFHEHPIRLIREATPGLTAARAAALQAARGTIVVFVDDDNVLEGGYLAEVSRVFAADAALGLLGGSVVPEYEKALPKWALDFEGLLAIRRYSTDTYRETTDVPYREYFPVGAGFAVRRGVGLAYLQDCADTTWIQGRRGEELSAGEDTDLGLFVLSEGLKLVVTGRLRLTHVIPSDRVTRDYLARLLVGIIRSSWELEMKWAARLGRPVFPALSRSLVNVLARIAVTGVLSLWSPKYVVKRRALMELARLKLRLKRR